MANLWLKLVLLYASLDRLEATVVTKYTVFHPKLIRDVMSCAQSSTGFSYCGSVISDKVCQPQTSKWCGEGTVKNGDASIVKDEVVETLEVTRLSKYERDLPTYLVTGSEIELKFILRKGWTTVDVNLEDENDKIVLQVKLQPKFMYLGAQNNSGEFGVNQSLLHQFTTDTEMVLKITTGVTSFNVSIKDVSKDYSTTLPAHTVRRLGIHYQGAVCDLLQVKFKAGSYNMSRSHP